MYLLTEWEGRTRPRAKHFPVRPELSQSISIVSHDHCEEFTTTELSQIASRRAERLFPAMVALLRNGPHTSILQVVLLLKVRPGPYGSYDNIHNLPNISPYNTTFSKVEWFYLTRIRLSQSMKALHAIYIIIT